MGTTRRVRRTGWAWDTFAQRIANTPPRSPRAAHNSQQLLKKKKSYIFCRVWRQRQAARPGGRRVPGRDDLTIRGPLIAQ